MQHFIGIYLVVALGVVLSVLLPILRRLLPAPSNQPSGNALQDFWKVARPYFVLGIFSLLVSILIVAVSGDALADWSKALLAGYAWDSTLQKATKN
jgi:hypothetical protein